MALLDNRCLCEIGLWVSEAIHLQYLLIINFRVHVGTLTISLPNTVYCYLDACLHCMVLTACVVVSVSLCLSIVSSDRLELKRYRLGFQQVAKYSCLAMAKASAESN